MRNLRFHTPFVAAVVLILAGAFSLAIADQVVYFTNGKAMMVKKVEEGDGVTILELEGGGRLGVPTAQILRIEEYAVSKPNSPRAPSAQQSRAAARPPAASPGVTNPQGTGAGATAGAAVNQPANLVADAPTVVPGVKGEAAAGLAAPRDVAQRPGAAAQGPQAGVPPPSPQGAGRPSGASATAAALAAQQSMAAKMQQRQRAGQLNHPNDPRGRNRSGGLHGSALMGGQPPRRPGQGVVQGGTTVPASASREEEIVQVEPKRSRGKGGASGKTPPPPEKDEKAEEPPSEAN